MLLDAGETVRAHEFHWSTLESQPSASDAAYRWRGDLPVEGFQHLGGTTLASYLHVHFAADAHARLPRRFVDRAAAARGAAGAG